MGTVVDGGTGRGVVVATGIASQLRRISVGLAGRPVETQFQLGLRRFSMLACGVGDACSRSADAEKGSALGLDQEFAGGPARCRRGQRTGRSAEPEDQLGPAGEAELVA